MMVNTLKTKYHIVNEASTIGIDGIDAIDGDGDFWREAAGGGELWGDDRRLVLIPKYVQFKIKFEISAVYVTWDSVCR